MIRLLIVDDIASTRENLQKLLSFEEDVEVIGTAGDGKQGLEEAHRLHPDIVLTDVNMPIMDGIQFTERLAAELPASPVIIMSVQGERDYLRRAMQAGAREYLIKPFSHDELVAAIRRVHQLEQKKGALSPKSPDTEATPRAAAAGHVIALFSGKGGVGKTLLATNLAVAVAQETKSRVALVDLDLQFGDVGVMLNLNHSRSITDIVEAGEGLETEMFNDVLGTGPAGIRVMLAPISPELADLITADHIRVVMAELRKSYDYVVVDTSCHLSEFNLEVIEMAQRILVMTTLTIPAIKDAKLALKVLESLNIDSGSILLIVNQSDGHSDFNRDSIEQNLRHPVSAQLPYDVKIVSESVTRGTPFVALNPDAAISRAVRDLVDLVAPQEAAVGTAADKKKRKGLFSR